MDYTVKHGDSLWRIAERNLGDPHRWPEIARLNHIQSQDLIFVGQLIHLPSTAASRYRFPVVAAAQPLRNSAKNSPAIAQRPVNTIPARGFFFVLADEINPLSRKLVRKVVVPDHGDPALLARLLNPERYGIAPRDPASPVSLGRHILGRTDSRFVSASENTLGSPRFGGRRYFIDAEKVERAGGKIHDGNAIAKDLDRISAKSKDPGFREYIEDIRKKALEVDREVAIEGEIPAAAVKSAGSMAITRSLQLVEGVGVVLTAYDLGHAATRSYATKSAAPVVAESVRQSSGWLGGLGGRVVAQAGVRAASRFAVAVADAEIGGEAGAAVGVETGPGAILTAAAGALIGGLVGFIAGDAAAKLISPDDHHDSKN